MVERTLESLASFVRDLGSACSIVKVHGNMFIGGSKNGHICAWSTSTGEILWSLEIDGLISDFDFVDDLILVTGSDQLTAISLESGEQKWSQELEGGGDFVRVVGGEIWVTSSVYDIELFDFLLASVYRFSKNGELIEKLTIDERPWFFSQIKSGILLGLGRPRCGILKLEPGKEAAHIEVDSVEPITCGAENSDLIVLGHADGSVSLIEKDTLNLVQTTQPANSLVSAIALSGEKWITGHEDGTVNLEGIKNSVNGSVDSVASFAGYCWIMFAKNEGAGIDLFNSGTLVQTLSHPKRINSVDSRESGLVIGDNSGKIIFFESGVVARRLNEVNEDRVEDERRALLKDRLRSLRN